MKGLDDRVGDGRRGCMYLGETHIDDCWLLGAKEGMLACRIEEVIGIMGWVSSDGSGDFIQVQQHSIVRARTGRNPVTSAWPKLVDSVSHPF